MKQHEVTYNFILALAESGGLYVEVSVIGIPQSIEDVERWLGEFLKLRNRLYKKYGIGIFQSVAESNKFPFTNEGGIENEK